ncbi:MAG: manganese efflux pump MntP family protein [Candidatus Zhuqueibacterota bacterium]
MDFVSTLFIALALAIDAFTVALTCGLIIGRITFRHTFRIGFHFGLFQFFMPIVGWLAGTTVHGLIASFDHWIAFLLLAGIGGKMIRDANSIGETRIKSDPSRGWSLVLFSIATSIDALAVGLSLGLLHVSILFPAVVIGVTTLLLSTLGINIGNRLGNVFKKDVEIVGGVILIGIGLRILYEHLLG